jgi:hypothetical protein
VWWISSGFLFIILDALHISCYEAQCRRSFWAHERWCPWLCAWCSDNQVYWNLANPIFLAVSFQMLLTIDLCHTRTCWCQNLRSTCVFILQVAGEHENELRLQQRSSAFEGGIVGESQDYNQGVENRYGPKRFLSDMRLEQCKPSLFLVFRCSFPFLSFFVSLFGLCCGVCC